MSVLGNANRTLELGTELAPVVVKKHERLELGTLEMDLTTRLVIRDGKPIELTAREFELL